MVVIILPTRKGPGFDPDYVRFKWAEVGINSGSTSNGR